MGHLRKKQYRDMLKTIVLLALPTMFEHLLSTLMQYVDTAMVGRLGADATAAVSTTTTITWLVNSISGAVGVAILTMIATGIGAGRNEYVKKTAAQAVLLSVTVGGIITAACIILSPYIPGMMGIDESVRALSSEYFMIISVPMVLRSFSIVLGSAIRATHDTRMPMIINLTANGLNVVLNYLLIYTAGLGVRGAAIATAISTALSGIWMLMLFLKKDVLRFDVRSLKPDKDILAEAWRIGFPVLATNFTSCLGYVVFAGMITGMGNVIFAAHSIAVTAEEFFYIPGYGLRNATQTLIGNSYGEGDHNKFKLTSRISMALTVLMMCISGFLLYIVARPLMSVFTTSQEVIDTGTMVLKMVAFSEPAFGILIEVEGIYYGLGKTKLPFIIETLSMWAVRILFTYLCVNIWHLSLRAVWFCMIADNILKALAFTIASFIIFRKKSFAAEFSVIGDGSQ